MMIFIGPDRHHSGAETVTVIVTHLTEVHSRGNVGRAGPAGSKRDWIRSREKLPHMNKKESGLQFYNDIVWHAAVLNIKGLNMINQTRAEALAKLMHCCLGATRPSCISLRWKLGLVLKSVLTTLFKIKVEKFYVLHVHVPAPLEVHTRPSTICIHTCHVCTGSG